MGSSSYRRKNTLTAADAERVEQAFQSRLTIVASCGSRHKKLNRHSIVEVEAKSGAEPPLSTRACWRCRRRVGFATGITSNQSPSNRASSAAAVRPMLTTCALRNHGRLVARSAMSSLFHSAGDTIARFIAVVMKPLGGIRPVSIRPSVLVPCG